jgi:hypothetical protein
VVAGTTPVLVHNCGRHSSGEVAAPSDYVGRHRVVEGPGTQTSSTGTIADNELAESLKKRGTSMKDLATAGNYSGQMVATTGVPSVPPGLPAPGIPSDSPTPGMSLVAVGIMARSAWVGLRRLIGR